MARKSAQEGIASVVVIIVIIAIAALGGVFVVSQRGSQVQEKFFSTGENINSQGSDNTSTPAPPSGLALPFKIEDISFDSGIINSFGIIRGNKDSGHGHGGIDFPLKPGSRVTAVASGEVIGIEKVSSRQGDEKLVVLIAPTASKQGWAFLYEHILVSSSLKVGDKVLVGDLLGTHVQEGFTSHYQLTFVFNEMGFTRENQCWPNLLKDQEKKELDIFWEQYRKTDYALGAWNSITEDGNYSFRGLLDKSKYPGGMQLCYPDNTDARVPI